VKPSALAKFGAVPGEKADVVLESLLPAGYEFAVDVQRAYAGLMGTAFADAEAGLGGRLLYAGELDGEGRALVAAANIAGAASLAATADRAAPRQAIRDGIADFLVNSLDEALRIFKNQLRKREPAAVCVGLAPELVECEMRERGVAPDLLRTEVPTLPYHEALVIPDAEQAENALDKTPALITWSVASAPAQWLPKLDAIALDCLGPEAWQARRWLRLAPRYLGRAAQGVHLLSCDREVAARFVERVEQAVDRGEIPVAFEIRCHFRGLCDTYRSVPSVSLGSA